MRSLGPCNDSSATPRFPLQLEGKIGLPRVVSSHCNPLSLSSLVQGPHLVPCNQGIPRAGGLGARSCPPLLGSLCRQLAGCTLPGATSSPGPLSLSIFPTPKQEGPGQSLRTSSWRWSKGWGSRKTGPGGERGLSSFLCPGCTPGSKSPLRIFPYGPPLTGILSKALISHDPYLTGPTFWGRGDGEDRTDKSEAGIVLWARR